MSPDAQNFTLSPQGRFVDDLSMSSLATRLSLEKFDDATVRAAYDTVASGKHPAIRNYRGSLVELGPSKFVTFMIDRSLNGPPFANMGVGAGDQLEASMHQAVGGFLEELARRANVR